MGREALRVALGLAGRFQIEGEESPGLGLRDIDRLAVGREADTVRVISG